MMRVSYLLEVLEKLGVDEAFSAFVKGRVDSNDITLNRCQSPSCLCEGNRLT